MTTPVKKVYVVKEQLQHDGTLYSPVNANANTVALDDEVAERLLALKVIALADAKAADDNSEPTTPDTRAVEIVNAMGRLEEGNKDHWLADGTTPELKALNKILGWKKGVSAKERETVMASLAAAEQE